MDKPISAAFHRRAMSVLVLAAGAAVTSAGRAQEMPEAAGASATGPTTANREINRTAPHSLFLEVGGPGIVYSINYDRMLFETFSLRVGATYFTFHELHDDRSGYFFSPVVANLLIGSARHKFEAGLGVVPGWAFPSRPRDYSGFQFNEVALAGYRYAPTSGGLTFRANVELLHLNSGFLPWGGISIGYGF